MSAAFGCPVAPGNLVNNSIPVFDSCMRKGHVSQTIIDNTTTIHALHDYYEDLQLATMASILAARDQENLVHNRQTTAAGKPLNQNIRALQAKTPGNLKTPFRSAAHDENIPIGFKGQKTVGKDGPSKLDKNAFVTPLPTRNRAPLGAKTTNAKARVFQTPAPAALNVKNCQTIQKRSTTRRSAKSKIAVAKSEPVETDILAKEPEEEEPDFGYAPPPPVELPDPPIESEEDPELTEELRRGHGSFYYFGSPTDEHGMSLRLKREEEEWKKIDEERVKKSLEGLDKPIFPTVDELNKQVDDMIAAGPKKKRSPLSRVDSTEARSAVAMLSEPQTRLPSAVMKPTHASGQKQKGITPGVRSNRPAVPAASASGRPNHAAVSKNTIGFPKAKKAPSIIPRGVGAERSGAAAAPKPIKIDQASIHPRDFRDLYGSPPAESDMWFRLKQYELLENDPAKNDDDHEEELFDSDFFPFDNAKLDDEDFQLPMPE